MSKEDGVRDFKNLKPAKKEREKKVGKIITKSKDRRKNEVERKNKIDSVKREKI